MVITHEDEVAAHAKRVLRMRDGMIERRASAVPCTRCRRATGPAAVAAA